MDIKFILLMTGIFLFTLGYVNQNKYNCNITPSLDKKEEQDLSNLFYKKDVLLERDPDSKIYDYRVSGTEYKKTEYSDQYGSDGELQSDWRASWKGTATEGGDNFNFSGDRNDYGQ
tara:strand:+ start:1112 stop:1459 length:348 start_codon:yes stop_codon:yes gene_type:complete